MLVANIKIWLSHLNIREGSDNSATWIIPQILSIKGKNGNSIG